MTFWQSKWQTKWQHFLSFWQTKWQINLTNKMTKFFVILFVPRTNHSKLIKSGKMDCILDINNIFEMYFYSDLGWLKTSINKFRHSSLILLVFLKYYFHLLQNYILFSSDRMEPPTRFPFLLETYLIFTFIFPVYSCSQSAFYKRPSFTKG